MTQANETKQRLKDLNSPERIFNAISAILARPIARIIKFIKELGRGRTPWLHAEDVNGKRFATFISPKAFQGYWWNEDCSVTVNLETGAKYQVSEVNCSCKDWYHRVRTGEKSYCKHQEERAKLLGINISDNLNSCLNSSADRIHIAPFTEPEGVDRTPNVERANQNDREPLKTPQPYNPANLYKINPDILDEGLSLERSDDYTCTEWYLTAWYKLNPFTEPAQRKIGRIVETDRGFMAAGVSGKARQIVSRQSAAIAWILRYQGMKYADIIKAYKESKLPRIKPKVAVVSSSAIVNTSSSIESDRAITPTPKKKYPKIIRPTVSTDRPGNQELEAFCGFF